MNPLNFENLLVHDDGGLEFCITGKNPPGGSPRYDIRAFRQISSSSGYANLLRNSSAWRPSDPDLEMSDEAKRERDHLAARRIHASEGDSVLCDVNISPLEVYRASASNARGPQPIRFDDAGRVISPAFRGAALGGTLLTLLSVDTAMGSNPSSWDIRADVLASLRSAFSGINAGNELCAYGVGYRNSLAELLPANYGSSLITDERQWFPGYHAATFSILFFSCQDMLGRRFPRYMASDMLGRETGALAYDAPNLAAFQDPSEFSPRRMDEVRGAFAAQQGGPSHEHEDDAAALALAGYRLLSPSEVKHLPEQVSTPLGVIPPRARRRIGTINRT